MKRDIDLIRNMLLHIESSDRPRELLNKDFLHLHPDIEIINYHLYLLVDANYICARDIWAYGQDYHDYVVKYLTNSGCDYLDSIRNDSIWESTKTTLSKIGDAAALDVIQTIASKIILAKLNL